MKITKDVTLRGFDYEFLDSEEYTRSQRLYAICMDINYGQVPAQTAFDIDLASRFESRRSPPGNRLKFELYIQYLCSVSPQWSS